MKGRDTEKVGRGTCEGKGAGRRLTGLGVHESSLRGPPSPHPDQTVVNVTRSTAQQSWGRAAVYF